MIKEKSCGIDMDTIHVNAVFLLASGGILSIPSKRQPVRSTMLAAGAS